MQLLKKILIALCLLCSAVLHAENTNIDIATALAGSAEGFEQALQPRTFDFPADHGAHPRFRNEWWYLTGQLQNNSGRRYGFQYTLFRVGLKAADGAENELWPRDTVWMAHVALSDIDSKQHWHSQRLSHGGAGSAGVNTSPFSAWLDNWQLNAISDTGSFPWQLQVDSDDFELRLQLDTDKNPVLQGDRGLSQKGGVGNASYYYSFTDLQAIGTLDGAAVSGSAWLDREWSTSVLPPGVVGWDWFSLQFQDGKQLMLYQLRSAKNDASSSRSGSLIAADGSSKTLYADDIKLQAMEHWISPTSGARYPTTWQLSVNELDETLTVSASFEDQELLSPVNYWEGVIDVSSPSNSISGSGYLEMTGYEPKQ